MRDLQNPDSHLVAIVSFNWEIGFSVADEPDGNELLRRISPAGADLAVAIENGTVIPPYLPLADGAEVDACFLPS
jgi:hypothetical protein